MGDKGDKRELSFEGVMPLDQLQGYIDDLAAALHDKAVPIERGTERLVLYPAATIQVKVKAKSKKDEESLRLELEWKRSPSAEFKIGDGSEASE